MNHNLVLTPSRYNELQDELEQLITVERPMIAERIRQARALGDLSENFDYQDAKRQQGFLEGKIADIKSMLEKAHIAEYATGGDQVALGASVTVWDPEFEEEIVYSIVGALDADAAQNRISNTSPIGSSLLGKRVGDNVKIQTPGGMMAVDVRKIEFQ